MPMHTNPFQYKHQQQSLLSRRHASKSFKILLQDTFSVFNLENFDIDSFPRGFKGRDRFFKGNWSINYKVEIGLLVEHLKTFFDELDESFKQLVFHRLAFSISALGSQVVIGFLRGSRRGCDLSSCNLFLPPLYYLHSAVLLRNVWVDFLLEPLPWAIILGWASQHSCWLRIKSRKKIFRRVAS